MILAVMVLFGLAVMLGLWLVVLGLRYQRGSLILAMLHVGLAVLGLFLLARLIVTGPTHKLYNLAALLFVLALCGGLVLLALRMSKREYHTPPPMIVVSMHAVMAMAALVLLITGYTHS